MSVCTCFTSAASVSSVDYNGHTPFFSTETAPVIDGLADDCYTLVFDEKNLPASVICGDTYKREQPITVKACWDSKNLYLYVEAECVEHTAYIEGEHYIFNACYMMCCVCPDDPGKTVYTGDEEDGGWSWGALNESQYVFEWTIISNSNTDETETRNHFMFMTDESDYEGVAIHDSTRNVDIYEQCIPLSGLYTAEVDEFLPVNGSIFGLGFSLGFEDVGYGYGSSDDYLDFSGYFSGKNVNELVPMVLVEKENETTTGEQTSDISADTSADTIAETTAEEIYVTTEISATTEAPANVTTKAPENTTAEENTVAPVTTETQTQMGEETIAVTPDATTKAESDSGCSSTAVSGLLIILMAVLPVAITRKKHF